MAQWCAAHGHPLVRLRYTGPQAPAHAVAVVVRDWYRGRGEPGDRLLVPSFVLGDPWRTIGAAAVPFWTFFAVQPALEALDAHLAAVPPTGRSTSCCSSTGRAPRGSPGRTRGSPSPAGTAPKPDLLALDPRRFPHDVASLGRYDRALAALPRATRPWTPLGIDDALDGLAAAGLDVVR